MTIENFIGQKIDDLKAIITNQLGNEFDSHEFIRCFAKKFESEYINFLANYESHKSVHSHIALGLAKYAEDLGIRKGADDVSSESVFGNDVPNKKWSKY
jgi:hypothetical protein